MTDNRIKQIADHYGLDIQLIQCASELNKLGAEVTRLALARKTGDPMKAFVTTGNIVGEIADVEIMCEQIKYLLKAGAAVDVVKEEKIRRQMKRAGLSTSSPERENAELKTDAEKWRELTKRAGKVGLTEKDLFQMVTPTQCVESEG